MPAFPLVRTEFPSNDPPESCPAAAVSGLRLGPAAAVAVPMTLPDERTRAVIAAGEMLRRLMSPYGDGYKRIPVEVRAEARRLLKHFPRAADLPMPGSFCLTTIRKHYEKEAHGRAHGNAEF